MMYVDEERMARFKRCWALSGIGAALLAGATAGLLNSCSTVYNREGADKVYAEVKLDPVSAIGSMFLNR